MCHRRAEHGLEAAELAVDLLPPFEVTQDRAGAHGNETSDLDMGVAQLARNDRLPLAGVGVLDPFEAVGQRLVKAAMDLEEVGDGRCPCTETALVDPTLDRDV